MEMGFFEIRHIYKTYSAVRALIDVSMEIRKGEIHCVVGENGCGKSTLMKIIGGVLQPDPLPESVIAINGLTMTNYSPSHAMYEGIQVIYQDLTLFPNLTVAENMTINDRISRKKHFVNAKTMVEQTSLALEDVQLNVDPYQYVEELSIAQQQLVAIARAITNNVKLLIMDEPTASLGKSDVNHLVEIIQTLKKRSVSIVFIGHKLDEVMKIADRITVMRDGRVVRDIDDISSVTSALLGTYMTGKVHSEHKRFEMRLPDNSRPILELKGYTKKGCFTNIDMQLHKGELLGIIGLVGAGRTELFSTVFGLEKPDSGDLFIDGERADIRNVQDAIKLGIALVPEDRLTEGLFGPVSIKQNINATTLDKHKRTFLLDKKKLESHSQHWVDTLKIKTPDHNNSAISLSGGNQQRIVLAKWLATHPKVLILDGPTIGIDVGAKSEIHKLIRELLKREELGVIMITDEIAEVMQNSSRIMVMSGGRFVLNARSEEVTEEQISAALGFALRRTT
jgi:simple sugar transport system ATP-binding protein